MKTKKKSIVLKMEFDLVDWTDNSYVPSFSEISSTLKIISIYKQTPEVFTKNQTKILTSWLKKNSITKFVKAKELAEKHQALLEEDGQFAFGSMWIKRFNTNH